MKFIVLKNQQWMFWAGGMVLYPFVIFSMRYPSRQLFRHELEHCYQVQRKGVFKFYTSYVFNLFKHGYRKHPDEIPAWDIQHTKLTEVEETWYKTGKINLED